MFPIRFTRAQEKAFNRVTDSYMFRNSFIPGKSTDNKVRDYAHLTGKLFGDRYKLCNIKRKIVYQILIFLQLSRILFALYNSRIQEISRFRD